jgi:threonine/homoserine/homoserine lactone efflux protein
MDLTLLAKGLIAGFVIAAPVGAVGILCVQRTLSKNMLAGLIAGGGAAIGDTLFGAIAAFGLTFIAEFLQTYDNWLRLIGGLLLLGLGALTVFKKIEPIDREGPSLTRHAGDFVSTFVLTISNPATILAFTPVFATLNAVLPPGDPGSSWTLILGVFAGSALWWLILCSLSSLFRTKLNDARMQLINRISGILIMIFGLIVLLSVTELGAGMLGKAL